MKPLPSSFLNYLAPSCRKANTWHSADYIGQILYMRSVMQPYASTGRSCRTMTTRDTLESLQDLLQELKSRSTAPADHPRVRRARVDRTLSMLRRLHEAPAEPDPPSSSDSAADR